MYFDRHNLPDLGPFTRFEFSTVGHIYDAGDRPLIELAREQREIPRYEDIPPIVRDAILAAEDKRFFSHNGIDYLSLPRVLERVRLGMLVWRTLDGAAVTTKTAVPSLLARRVPTITQQLVRGNFLGGVTARENSYELRPTGLASRGAVVGHGRTQRQHAGPEARGNTALVLARAGDVGPVRFEATCKGRDSGPLRRWPSL